MLEWACAGDGPSLALLADHDGGDREFRYAGAAGTAAEAGPITDVARRLGCTVGEHGTGLAEDLPRPVVADAPAAGSPVTRSGHDPLAPEELVGASVLQPQCDATSPPVMRTASPGTIIARSGRLRRHPVIGADITVCTAVNLIPTG